MSSEVRGVMAEEGGCCGGDDGESASPFSSVLRFLAKSMATEIWDVI